MGSESGLPERRAPTHTLTISIPLDLQANPAAEESDIQEAFRQAVTALVPVTRLGTLGLLCGDIAVEVKDTEPEPPLGPGSEHAHAIDDLREELDLVAEQRDMIADECDRVRQAVTDIAGTPHELGPGGRLQKARSVLAAHGGHA